MVTARKSREVWWAVGLGFLFWLWISPGWWKLGFGLINAVILLAFFWKQPKTGKNRWAATMGILSFGLGIMMAVRSFETVGALTVLTVFVLDILIGATIKERRVELLPSRIITTGLDTAKNSFGLIWRLIRKWPLGKVTVGAMMAIPLLLLFGGLFYSADPIFAKIIDSVKLPRIDVAAILRIAAAIWFSGQVLAIWQSKFGKTFGNGLISGQKTEISVAVGILEMLFLAFSAIQIKYWGVGGETLQQMGITYSEYTRRGYVELIVVSVLAWLIVLVLDQLQGQQRERKISQTKIIQGLGGLILAQIILFVAGATKRNLMYMAAYGFTRVRLLGMALSGWIIAVMVLTAIKFFGKAEAGFLGKGLVIITAVAVMALNIINIDKVIVDTRPASLPDGVDYIYLSKLSDDARKGWIKIYQHWEERLAAPDLRQEEIEKASISLANLNRKRANLEKQAGNFWQYGGGWNWANFNSRKELESGLLEKWQKNIEDAKERVVIIATENLVSWLRKTRPDWRVIYPYGEAGGSRKTIAIETKTAMDSGAEPAKMETAVIGGGQEICRWKETGLNPNKSGYLTIITCGETKRSE